MNRVAMIHSSNNIQPGRASTPIKSYMISKVYEDQVMGIVCYRDRNGEVVCEGYDEGPRYSQQTSRKTCQQRNRELQITSFLQWLQIAEDAEFQCVKEVAVKEQN